MEQRGEHTLGGPRRRLESVDAGDYRLLLPRARSLAGAYGGLGIALFDERNALAIGLHDQYRGVGIGKRGVRLFVEVQDRPGILEDRLLQSPVGEGASQEVLQNGVGLGIGDVNAEALLPLSQQIRTAFRGEIEIGIGGKGPLSATIVVTACKVDLAEDAVITSEALVVGRQ
jgi:hypothetical protein